MLQKLTVLLFAVILAFTTNAQSLKTNPFKPIPKPVQTLKSFDAVGGAVNPTITAWRFTPAAGYNVTTKQLMAGIGYGIQWMHFVDSTQKYYTTFSIQGIGWVNGTTAPTLNPPNFASFGISAGFFNQLIMVGGAYSPATADRKGQLGLVVNLAVPLNN